MSRKSASGLLAEPESHRRTPIRVSRAWAGADQACREHGQPGVRFVPTLAGPD